MKIADDFLNVTGEIARRLDVRLESLQELEGGRSGARNFLVLVTSLKMPAKPSHMILRIESARRGAKTAEGHEAARLSLGRAFVLDHMVAPGFGPATFGEVTATIYKLAGGSLMQWRPLTSYSRQAVVVGFYRRVTEDVLNEFSSGEFSLRHPQELLKHWLQNRVDRVENFLKEHQADSQSEGYIIRSNAGFGAAAQQQMLANPWWYLQEPERWGAIRKINALRGRNHGDLHPGNILAHGDDPAFKNYVLIDFDRYQADSFLFFDQRVMELGFLIERAAVVPYTDWKELSERLAEPAGGGSVDDLPLDLSGPFTLADAGKKSFLAWLNAEHLDKTDDLVGQYLLAAVAAGLSFCNKKTLSVRERWVAFTYAAVHLNAVLAQFGARLPAQATELRISPQSEREERFVFEQRRRKQFRKTGIAVLLAFVITSAIGLIVTNRYSSVVPDFQPAWTEEPHPNASSVVSLYSSNDIPKSVDWFRYDGNDEPLQPLGPEKLDVLHLNTSKYISFHSALADDMYSWTGLFLHRLPWFPAAGLFRWRAHETGDLVAVINSGKTDRLEVGLKDTLGGERKLVLSIQPGWNGYRIHLRDFSGVNTADLDQVILAHSRTVGSTGTNTFKIAALALR